MTEPELFDLVIKALVTLATRIKARNNWSRADEQEFKTKQKPLYDAWRSVVVAVDYIHVKPDETSDEDWQEQCRQEGEEVQRILAEIDRQIAESGARGTAEMNASIGR